MSLILSCNAAKVDDKSIVVSLIVDDDFNPALTHVLSYVLPTQREAFSKGVLRWWSNTKKDIIPWRFNKNNTADVVDPDAGQDAGKGARYNLQKLFIEYTTKQLVRVYTDPDGVALHLDQYYETLFQPSEKDIPKLDKITAKAQARTEAHIAKAQAEQKKIVADYCATAFGTVDDETLENAAEAEDACEAKAAALRMRVPPVGLLRLLNLQP